LKKNKVGPSHLLLETNNPQFQQVEFDLSIYEFEIFSEDLIPTNIKSDDEFSFLISDDQGDTWSVIQTWTAEDVIEPNTKILFDLATYGGIDAVFAFYHTTGTAPNSDGYSIIIDNLKVRDLPTCIEISNLSTNNIEANEATITWSENGASTIWDVEFVESGMSPTGMPSSAYNDINSNAVVLSGLSPNTSYDVYVRSDCGMDNESDISEWTGPLTFETACAIFLANYLEDFSNIPNGENLPNCWLEATGSLATGPTQFNTNNWLDGTFTEGIFEEPIQVYLSSYFSNEYWLLSPMIGLMGATFQLEFDIRIKDFYGDGLSLFGDDVVHVLITTDNMQTWDIIQTFDAKWMNSIKGDHITVDLSEYTGENVRIAFYATDGISEDTDVLVAFDNVAINWFGQTPMTLDIQVTDVSCFGGNDGAAEVDVTGGTPPYNYEWESTTPSNLSIGVYGLTVTDNNGLEFITSFLVNEPPLLSVNTEAINESVAGFADGTIDLQIQGGTADYTYLWDNGATTEDLTGIEAGTYCVTITDANDCTESICETIISESTSNQDLSDIQRLNIYPNPVHGSDLWIDIEFSTNKNISIQLINSLGQVLHHQAIDNILESQINLQVGNLPEGLYFVNILDLDNQKMTTEKVLIK